MHFDDRKQDSRLGKLSRGYAGQALDMLQTCTVSDLLLTTQRLWLGLGDKFSFGSRPLNQTNWLSPSESDERLDRAEITPSLQGGCDWQALQFQGACWELNSIR